MIRRLVDFALNNRWLVVGATVILFAWGAISFHSLPVEAYPDVANNYVQIITQWPGRAAEEVEQQVTIPIEIQMAGIPHLEHLRSTSLAGLSSIMLIFDDDSVNKDNRQEVFQRLGLVTLPAGLQPQMGTDWSPVGQIYWYTLRSTNPAYDSMELKSLEDWKLEKAIQVRSRSGRRFQLRRHDARVPDPRRPRQTRRLRPLHRPGRAADRQQQRQRRRQLHRAGRQQINVREVGLYRNVQRHRTDRAQDPERRSAARQRHRRPSSRGRRSAWARSARPAASAQRRPPSPTPPTAPIAASNRLTRTASPPSSQNKMAS